MAENKLYIAVGEEAARGTAQVVTVGFIPTDDAAIPKLELDDKLRKEFRGENSVLGDTAVRRMSRKWGGSIKMPFFTEAGTTKGMVGTLLKHLFGKVNSAQNAATGQYYHMMFPVADPFATANLGDKALTLNCNINEGTVMKNWPFVGGRIKSLSLDQEPGSQLKASLAFFGQFEGTVTAELGSPAYAAENLRCDYNNLKVYTGTISRTGTGPDFTAITFGSATQLKPDKISLKLENGFEDAMRLSGVNYPDKTRVNGQFKASLELTIDWEDPASGFSSVDEFNAWLASASSTNFALHWDTGVQAGTGDNHGLIIDLPIMRRVGGDLPSVSLDKDPMITLKYEGLYDATTCKYIAGLMLKNTASAV